MNNDNSISQINKVVLIINWSLDIFLTLGYIVEYLKGAKSLAFVSTFIFMFIVPVIISTVIFLKNKESRAIKTITLVGYLITYICSMFATSRLLLFVYFFPIATAYLLYFDLTLMIGICGTALLINVVRIIYHIFVLNLNSPTAITDYTIQFGTVFLFGLSLILTTKLSNKLNREKINSLELKQKEQESILQDVLKTSSILDNNSKKVFEIVEQLSLSTNIVSENVDRTSLGTQATSKNIQDQSELTYNIHKVIEHTHSLSNNMSNTSIEAINTVNQGIDIVENLDNKTKYVNQNSENVFNSINELKNESSKIQNVTQIIASIASQTNLLSLNASIESARAGEAGKGFAIVANEIRKLALECKESSECIENILSGLQVKADESVNECIKLMKENKEQEQLVNQNRVIFETVHQKISNVNSIINEVNVKVNEILSSNNQIVERINEISAVSEETAASMEETYNVSQDTIKQIDTAKQLVQELIDTSNLLSKYY